MTATDISAIALGRAGAAAHSAGVTHLIDWQGHDFEHSLPTERSTPCPLNSYGPRSTSPREQLLRSAAQAVSPGGLMLIVNHAAFPPWSPNQDDDVRFPTAQETLESLDLEAGDWRIDRVKEAERSAAGPDGTVGTLIVAVTRLR